MSGGVRGCSGVFGASPLMKLSRHRRLGFVLALSLSGLPAFAAQPSEETPKATSPPPVATTPTSKDPPPPAPEAAEPPEAEVLFKDGRRLAGILLSQSAQEVVLNIEGIETPIPRGEIDRVHIRPSFDDQYRALRLSVDQRDLPGRLKLAEWLLARKKFDLALAEVGGVLTIEPGNTEAQELKTLIQQQQQLAKHAGTGKDTPEKAPKPAPEPRVKFPLITDEQLNILRVYELDLTNPPQLTIPRATITKLIEKYAGQPEIPISREGKDAFYRKPAAEIVAIMFRLRARELYPEVKVHDNPESLRRFRDDVHRQWLLNSCASAHCHGGLDAGRLYLAGRNNVGDRLVFTNLLILDRHRLPSGQALIDYTEPARSPLLQMALPREMSLVKHPDVEMGPTHQRWRPIFRSQEDPKFLDAVAWIKSMFKPRPDYPIEYTPPIAKRESETPPAAPQAEPGSR